MNEEASHAWEKHWEWEMKKKCVSMLKFDIIFDLLRWLFIVLCQFIFKDESNNRNPRNIFFSSSAVPLFVTLVA